MELDEIRKIMHEIKQPIANIKATAAVIETMLSQDSFDKETIIDFSRAIQTNCSFLSLITNNIYDLAYKKENILTAEYTSRSIGDYINSYTNAVRPFVMKRNVTFSAKLSTVNDQFVCDYEKLTRILNNLVCNAVKYNDKDEKQVTLFVGENNGMLEFSVRDNGIGIPKNEIALITKCHYRATNIRRIVVDGCGLGLNIVSELVCVLGGTLEVESTVGKGSCFTVRLPGGKVSSMESASLTISALEPHNMLEAFSCILING